MGELSDSRNLFFFGEGGCLLDIPRIYITQSWTLAYLFHVSGFFPLHISYGVKVTDLLVNTLRIRVTVPSTYPQRDINNFDKLTIDRTMSNKV